jgi:hypothetical protein
MHVFPILHCNEDALRLVKHSVWMPAIVHSTFRLKEMGSHAEPPS